MTEIYGCPFCDGNITETVNEAIAALPHLGAAGVAVPRWQPTHRHVRRGSEYKVLGFASLQAAEPCYETAALVVYQGSDGKLWARPHDEFSDGRFEALPAALVPSPVPQEAEPETFMGYHVVSDPTIAPHAGELRDRDGNVLARFDFGAPVPQEATAEPVAWQCRFRNGWNMDAEWGDWKDGRVKVHLGQPYYEERALYASPPSHDAELLAAREWLRRLVEDHYDDWMDGAPDDFKIGIVTKLTLGDLRALRAALEQSAPVKGGE